MRRRVSSPRSRKRAEESRALETRIQHQDARIEELEKQLAKTLKEPPEPILLAQAATPAAAPQDAAAQQPAPTTPATAAPPAPTALTTPSVTGPLAMPPPVVFDAGPLGKLAVDGDISGLGMWQGNHVPGDNPTQAALSNGQIFIQKTDGWFQFFVQAGVYTLPSLATPFLAADKTLTNFYGPVPRRL